jgi:hypothetical protein
LPERQRRSTSPKRARKILREKPERGCVSDVVCLDLKLVVADFAGRDLVGDDDERKFCERYAGCVNDVAGASTGAPGLQRRKAGRAQAARGIDHVGCLAQVDAGFREQAPDPFERFPRPGRCDLDANSDARPQGRFRPFQS